jgi:hypothetical protein
VRPNRCDRRITRLKKTYPSRVLVNIYKRNIASEKVMRRVIRSLVVKRCFGVSARHYPRKIVEWASDDPRCPCFEKRGRGKSCALVSGRATQFIRCLSSSLNKLTIQHHGNGYCRWSSTQSNAPPRQPSQTPCPVQSVCAPSPRGQSSKIDEQIRCAFAVSDPRTGCSLWQRSWLTRTG